MKVPTVRVKSSHPEDVQGFYLLNESDFDPKIHTLWVDEAEEARSAAIKRDEAMKAAAAIKAAQVNAGKPVLGMSSGNKPDQTGVSSGVGSDRNR
jgi:hypothetical protein